MRKLFLILLISITLSLTINFITYSQSVPTNETNLPNADMTFDPSVINYSLRNTSDGKMIEFKYDYYNQWLANYKFLLIENIDQRETIKTWEDNYNQLLNDTVWRDSFDKCLQTVETVELDYQTEVRKNKILSYGLAASGLIILVETIIIIYGG